MAREYKINEPTDDILKWRKRWAKNRAVIDGQDTVKDMGELFLPKIRADDSTEEYDAHKLRTNFYPAVNKIAQGIIGLMLRKPPQLKSSARVEELAQVISSNSESLPDFSENLLREKLTNDFTGLLADSPDRSGFGGLSAANEDQLGFRPFLNLYRSESILEVTASLVRGRRAFTRVRLLEDDGQVVRELILNRQGVYEVLVHKADGNGNFNTPPSRVTPRDAKGTVWNEIPFVLDNTSGKLIPQPSPLAASVDLNLQHYVLSGTLAQMTWQTSNAVMTAIGFDPGQDDEGNDKEFEFDTSPGSIIAVKDPNVKIEWFIYDPKGAQLVIDQLKSIKDDLSTLGHSMIAPEKAAPEAAETILLRKAAENATLAAMSRSASDSLQTALRFVARFADDSADELEFSLNTDFAPQRLSAQDIAALSALVDKGLLSRETFTLALRDGEIISSTIKPEEEADRIDQDLADRPTTATL